MISSQNKELKIFGYGLGLLIPFILSGPILKMYINFYIFVGLFILLLVVINYVDRARPIYYLVLGVIYMFLSRRFASLGVEAIPVIFLILSIVALLMAILKPSALSPLYKIWMRAAHFFGNVVTIVLLTVFYYLAFGIPGIILKILKKDLLAERINKNAASYWIKKVKKTFNKEDYTRQF